MKIECTKEEWAYLEMLLLLGANTSTGYFGNFFRCQVQHNEGDLAFYIQGEFK